MSVTVYTALIGDTDTLRPPLVIDRRARYLCFADRRVSVPPYRWIPVEGSTLPRLASRIYKVLADHPALATALTLWHDASYQLTRDVQWVREVLAGGPDLMAFRHHVRRTPKREARRLVRYGYLTADEAAAHLARYRAEGYRPRGSVTCGGLLARRRSPRMTDFNRRWWAEVQQWHGRDQTSLDYVAWAAGITVGHLDGQIKANAYAQWRVPVEVAA